MLDSSQFTPAVNMVASMMAENQRNARVFVIQHTAPLRSSQKASSQNDKKNKKNPKDAATISKQNLVANAIENLNISKIFKSNIYKPLIDKCVGKYSIAIDCFLMCNFIFLNLKLMT